MGYDNILLYFYLYFTSTYHLPNLYLSSTNSRLNLGPYPIHTCLYYYPLTHLAASNGLAGI